MFYQIYVTFRYRRGLKVDGRGREGAADGLVLSNDRSIVRTNINLNSLYTHTHTYTFIHLKIKYTLIYIHIHTSILNLHIIQN